MKNINTIGRYWKKKHGEKVYKVPISISGFTCPNIDGTVAKGGCTFCENESFSQKLQPPFATVPSIFGQVNPEIDTGTL